MTDDHGAIFASPRATGARVTGLTEYRPIAIGRSMKSGDRVGDGGPPKAPSRALCVGATLGLCLVVLGAAIGAEAPSEPPKDPPKFPLTMEVVPGTVVLDRADAVDVLVLVGNAGTTPLRSVTFRLHVPADVTQVEERWDVSPARAAGSAPYAVPDFAPLEQRVVKLTLVHRGPWTAVKSASLVVHTDYTWQGPRSAVAVPGEALRLLAVKIGALEGLSVLGVPLALAIFVVPGLLGLSLFAAFLREPIKWIDDNKLFVSFLGSVLLILLWNRGLRSWVRGPDLWSGVSIELLLAFSVVAGILGGLAGWIVRKRQHTQAELWPVTQTQPLRTLLANLAERGMLPAFASTVNLPDGTVLSAVAADTDVPDQVVLLPRRYRITTTDERLRRQFAQANVPGPPAAAFARLLRRNPAAVTVADGIKQRDAAGAWAPVDNGNEPRWVPREGLARAAEGDGIFLPI